MSKHILTLIIAVGIAACSSLRLPGQNPNQVQDAPTRSESDRNRLEESGPAIVKQFVASLRYGDSRMAELQKLIDPRYVKKYHLQAGRLLFQKFVTKSIFDLQVSDDPQTVLCITSTEESARETILFRTTIYERNVYLLPLAPPDAKTGIIKPWILRTKY